jgi:hypothetical protein
MPNKQVVICPQGLFDQDGNQLGYTTNCKIDITQQHAVQATVTFLNPILANYPPTIRTTNAVIAVNNSLLEPYRNLSSPDLTDAEHGIV